MWCLCMLLYLELEDWLDKGACGTMSLVQRYVSNAYAKNMDLWLLSYDYIVILAWMMCPTIWLCSQMSVVKKIHIFFGTCSWQLGIVFTCFFNVLWMSKLQIWRNWCYVRSKLHAQYYRTPFEAWDLIHKVWCEAPHDIHNCMHKEWRKSSWDLKSYAQGMI